MIHPGKWLHVNTKSSYFVMTRINEPKLYNNFDIPIIMIIEIINVYELIKCLHWYS